MASTYETHSGVAGVAPHGQPRTLHSEADESKTAQDPRPQKPVGSITRGEAEGPATGPGSTRPNARERQLHPRHNHQPANRVFVVGADGRPLAPCTIQRARELIKARRVKRRDYNPFTIQLKDRTRDDNNTSVHDIEVRVAPGSRGTGIAVVLKLDDEDRVLYQEEIEHRTDISRRLTERKGHRKRRRGEKWYRAPRFNNRRRAPGWLPPTIESIVSNQFHRTHRLAERSGAPAAVVQTGKFDTHKPHLRAYVAARENHTCIYCGKRDWESSSPFNLDHVVPRSAGGPTNVRNVVWSCKRCNERKAARPVEEFLKRKPKRLAKVLGPKRTPLAAAGQYAAVCQELVRRLTQIGLDVTKTTGADTAHARKEQDISRSKANNAACCGSTNPVTQLRQPLKLTAVGHGRRKQIKGLPTGPYLHWRHSLPAEQRATPCPRHARHPNLIHGIQTGDTVKILTAGGWRKGRARVQAARGRVLVQGRQKTLSTTKATRIRKIAPVNGYRRSN
ncbi:MAG: RRXRR domain-containing protein [Acidimicrobiaceae bacterium]|nr:RRXRR domain-containing protein [Acidimicrobiaceae bacterium]